MTTTEYRTGWIGRSNTIHVLRIASPDPFWRPLCSHRWYGSITTLSKAITPEDQAGELEFVGCKRCHKAFSRIEISHD